ncbi:MAG: mercury resistance system periplasmic binding protein MerP [Candidimonas sp.]|nr:MAG: mercury resistance system periplasmic binding protein MerP [Candidimonas sp.]
MQKLFLIALLAAPLVALAAPPRTVTLDVRNMTCALCPITVKKSLLRVVGVSAAKVDYAKKTAVVTYDPAKVSLKALTQATTNAGYPSTVQR